MNSLIKSINGMEILDSRGFPTLRVRVELEDGSVGVADSPSGSSISAYERFELRDEDPKRYQGLGLKSALQKIQTEVSPTLVGQDAREQTALDKSLIRLDGTQERSRLGTNVIYAASVAISKAASVSLDMELFRYYHSFTSAGDYKMPIPQFNIFNGGAHAQNKLKFQEYLIIPSGLEEFSEQLRIGAELDYKVRDMLHKRGESTAVGYVGGYSPFLLNDEQALDLLQDILAQNSWDNYVRLGLDSSVSRYWEEDQQIYVIPEIKYGSDFVGDHKALVDFYRGLSHVYPIRYIEDGLGENDWDGWDYMNQEMEENILLAADDLTATNIRRVETAIEKGAVDAILIKPNQTGTLTEVFKVVKLCQENNIKIVVSHRGGETTDTFLSDFAVGIGASYCKFGAPVRGERTCKYNRLLEIAQII